MRAYHATRALKAVTADGCVRPMRMDHVYAFLSKESADRYAEEFEYEGVVEVEVDPSKIIGRWKPAYSNGETVLKIEGEVPLALQEPLGPTEEESPIGVGL